MDEIDFKKLIDIDAIFAQRFPGAYKILPKWILNFIKKKAHQEDLINLLERHKKDFGLDWIHSILDDFEFKTKVEDEHYAASPGRHIYVSNHPLGGLDGMALLRIIAKYHPKFHSLSNDMLMHIPNVSPFVIPVNRGKSSRDFFRKLTDALAGEAQILTFPASVVSRKKRGQIRDFPWTKSFINMATKHQRSIIPIYFEGSLSNFFYRLCRMVDLLKINKNLNVLFLIDETFNQGHKEYYVRFGAPIPYQQFDSSKTPYQWAQVVRQQVYKLAPDKERTR